MKWQKVIFVGADINYKKQFVRWMKNDSRRKKNIGTIDFESSNVEVEVSPEIFASLGDAYSKKDATAFPEGTVAICAEGIKITHLFQDTVDTIVANSDRRIAATHETLGSEGWRNL
jgi:nucleoid-associated protein YgaU